jgi:hypothetical protein
MRRITGWVCAALVAAFGSSAVAAEKSSLKKENLTFGTLSAPSEVAVRVQSANWLKEAGKYDANRAAFDAIWAEKDKSLMDRVAATFSLGDAQAAKVLAEARNSLSPAPTTLPAVLQDNSKPIFFRANLALSYAKALSNRKVYEEALETMKLFKADQVVDPASFLFHKAVAEHGLMLKKEANLTIAQLLDDVPTAPERYRMVAALMHFDMVSWTDRDVLDKLATIGRKMDNVQRRLGLERGGKKTQKQQKDVVARLDELIKELENQANSDCPSCPNGGNCPSGGQAKKDGPPSSNIQASSPQKDSNGGDGKGPGEVEQKKIKELTEVWGKLSPRERDASMRELTRSMDARYRDIVQDYFRRLSAQQQEVSK